MSGMSERFLNGVFKENPTFVLLLGMCPTLAVTTSAANGLGMGITTLVVLAMSNLFISLLRKVIPDKIRIPAFIVIIASFVTMVELLLNAYLPGLYKNLGLYIPLIVVNCIILGRAEAYAYSHSPLLSLFDGLGMGTGFTFALTIIGAVREILGTGDVFGYHVMPKGYVPVSIFIMAPGAFFVLALLTAIQNKIKEIGERKGKDMSKIQSGCGHDCLNCNLECATPDIKAAALKTSEPETTESSEEDKAAESEDRTEKNKKDKKNKSRDKKRDR
ncbi:MAG: electron transport complex subunit E, partial [Lachnospiraceae bacterium]|nr:electron transport complex subunit E [Lachnospiraceae bacterium]